MAFIYVITNDINGKQYIGKTNQSIEKRFQQHINDSKRNRCEKRPLYAAMNKYGIEHFSIKILEECSTDESADKEIYWINKMKTYSSNGYNATKGGDGKQYYNYEEIAEKYLELLSVKDTANFFHCTADTIHKACIQEGVSILSSSQINKNKYGKLVIMYNKDTEKPIKVFNSLKEAGLFLGDKTYAFHIGKAARGKRKTAYGYKWRYALNNFIGL